MSAAVRFVRAGLVDQAEVFPGHRYRFSGMAEKRNRTLLERLARAEEVLA